MRAKLITLALALSLPIVASATTYNVVTDFSLANNSNGVWTYGYGSGVNGTFTKFTDNSSTFLSVYGLGVWSNGDQLPAIGTTAGTTYGTVDIPSNFLFLHPGNEASNSDAIVEFTAPTSGLYNITGDFVHLDDANAGTGQVVEIFVDGVGGGAVNLGTTYGIEYPITGGSGVFLNQGEIVSFDVAKDGDYSYDSTGLQLTISNANTPEPSSLVLLGTGIMGLAGAARRKLRS